jgi:ATP-dependent Clp protease ATP-binding subunit ClpA
MEDEFSSILDMCGGDNIKAEKAIIVLDEFDKLGTQKLDIKKDLINVFLKVLEGGNFPINRQLKQTRTFNTLMSSKVALGTFTDAFIKDKAIGFNSSVINDEIFDEKLLVKKGYFTNELLTRFQHFIPYKELSEEDKKK